MNSEVLEALSRTTMLIGLDVFGQQEDPAAIVAGLAGTTVEIVADERNASSPSAQTFIASLTTMLVRMGIGVILDVPDVQLRSPQPPLAQGGLRTSLEQHVLDAIPRLSAPVDTYLRVIVGTTPWHDGSAIRASGDDWSFRAGPADLFTAPWQGEWPFGAIGGAAAMAAEGLRAALPGIATNLGVLLGDQLRWRLDPLRPVEVNLTPGTHEVARNLGPVDVVSAGAISNAALYTLLRVPGLAAALRVFDWARLDLSNLNRYPLALWRDAGRPKVEVLADFATDRLRVEPIPLAYDLAAHAAGLRLGPTVLVGVDDIPSRWFAQAAAPGLVIVGGTTHDFAMVSSHAPDGACAACAHPRDERLDGDIPTISFVSMWAGLLEARALVANISHVETLPRTTWVNTLSLREETGILDPPIPRNARCPLRCGGNKRLTLEEVAVLKRSA